MMKIKKVLLYYKESTYKNYFLNKGSSLKRHMKSIPEENIKRFKTVHKMHYETIDIVEKSLKELGIHYNKSNRGTSVNFKAYDLIVTLGGDGTFLQAARNIKNQYILGVNSTPPWSVGKFCRANRKNFHSILKRITKGQARALAINRLQIKPKHKTFSINILNDVLIAHKNPAAMSRYLIQIGRKKEEQRSSGVWIATAAGSSGAVRSAGGRALPIFSKLFQYKPRELYKGFRSKYHLRGGLLPSSGSIKITSLMREGIIFIDGARNKLPFPMGQSIVISKSPDELKVMGF